MYVKLEIASEVMNYIGGGGSSEVQIIRPGSERSEHISTREGTSFRVERERER